MTPAAASAADMSRAAASTTDMSRAAAAMTTTAAAAMTTPASAAAMTTPASAAAAASCKSYASGKRRIVFFVEDVEGRQADVGDFFLTENNSASVVLRRYILCRRGC
jgi:hypothetical protein